MEAIVIGTGFGAQVMAPAYAKVGINARVISSRDSEAIKNAMTEKIDLVSVHSPPFLHREHVMMALDHGHAVLCDKPFGRNAEDARHMRDRARSLGTLSFLNFEFRWQPERVHVKQLLDQGTIGDLRHINWSMFGNGLRRKQHGWLFDADLAGGWIGAYGGHAVDALRWLTGHEIVQTGGISRIEIPSRPDRDGALRLSTAEDAVSAWFVLDNGCTVNFDTAFCTSVMMPERLIFLGSAGSLELIDNHVLILRRPGQAAETTEFPPPPPEGSYDPSLRPWLTAVRDAIKEGRQITPNFDDGVATTAILDQLHGSIVRLGSDFKTG